MRFLLWAGIAALLLVWVAVIVAAVVLTSKQDIDPNQPPYRDWP